MTLLDDPTRIHVIQGEFRVSESSDIVLTTVLGSCVAACIRDPVAKIGGLNHFLLPGSEERRSALEAEQYGVHLMELLLNALLRSGAARHRLEAKIFGGAHLLQGLADIGERNADFAERFLRYESITMLKGSVGGHRGRRIEFWPVNGRTRQCLMTVRQESRSTRPTLPPWSTLPPRPYVPTEVEFF